MISVGSFVKLLCLVNYSYCRNARQHSTLSERVWAFTVSHHASARSQAMTALAWAISSSLGRPPKLCSVPSDDCPGVGHRQLAWAASETNSSAWKQDKRCTPMAACASGSDLLGLGQACRKIEFIELMWKWPTAARRKSFSSWPEIWALFILQCPFLAAFPWRSFFFACPNALEAGKPTAASNVPAAPCHSEESQGSPPCWGSTWIDGTSLWCSEQASCTEALTCCASPLAAA